MGAGVRRWASLRVPLPSAELAEAALKALRPEAERPPSDRFSVSLRLEGTVLVVEVAARDTSSLRAALNSYISWLRALMDACLAVSRP